MIAADASPLGGHLAHVILFAVWVGIVVVVLLVDHVRSRMRGSDPSGLEEPQRDPELSSTAVTHARVSMATWPPARSAVHQQRPAVPAGERATSVRLPVHRAPSKDPAVLRLWLSLAVVGSLSAAAVHYIVMPEHIAESYWYGAFFAGAATVQTAMALLLAMRPTRTLLRAAAAGNAATVLLWGYTRVVGVPIGPDHGQTESVGRLDVLATTAEAVIVLACVLALLRLSRARQAAGTT